MNAPPPTDPFPHKATLWDAHLRELKHGISIAPARGLYHVRSGRDIVAKPVSDLTLSDVSPLLHREVALYDLVFGGSAERVDLFRAIWEAWVPHRDRALTLEAPRVEKPTIASTLR